MAQRLQIKDNKNAKKLLDEIYDELKGSDNLSDGEIAEHIQFMWYNIESKKYEAVYYGPSKD